MFTHTYHRKSIFWILILGIAFCNLNCSNSNKKGKEPDDDIAKEMLNSLGDASKYYILPEGYSSKANIVLLVAQGGPLFFLGTYDRNRKIFSGPVFKEWYPYFTIVHVHQAQTLEADSESDGLDARLLSGKEKISIEKARQSNLKSAAILHKVAMHFKEQGKIVYAMTSSFGSFVVLHTLAKYGNNFNKLLVMIGRVDMPSEVVTVFRDECGGEFAEDATTFVPKSCEDALNGLSETGKNSLISAGKLQAALGENTYSNLLANVDLSNMLYLYGGKDRAVGKLSSAEVSFLKGRKAQVLELPNRGHEHSNIEALPDSRTAKGLEEESKSRVFNFLHSPPPSSYELLTMLAENTLSLYLGSESDSEDSKFDIAIVFEGHSQKQISYKMNELFGDGPYSLFKTDVFNQAKSKFRIRYGQLAQSSDTNDFGNILNDEHKKEISKIFIQIFPEISSSEEINFGLDQYLADNNINKESIKPRHYMDILAQKNYDKMMGQLSSEDQAHKIIIENNIQRFTSFFEHENNSNKTFDLKIYVSSGISGSFADLKNKLIYLSSSEFSSRGNPTTGINPHVFAATGVHEIGHIVGDLLDEYYAYHLTEIPSSKDDLYPSTQENARFRNNCFSGYSLEGAKTASITLDKIFVANELGGSLYNADDFNFDFTLTNINNPWTHPSKVPIFKGYNSNGENIVELLTDTFIPDYDGHIYEGCGLEKGFTGTQNSIMSIYQQIKASEWSKGWGPINSFYLKKGLEGF